MKKNWEKPLKKIIEAMSALGVLTGRAFFKFSIEKNEREWVEIWGVFEIYVFKFFYL